MIKWSVKHRSIVIMIFLILSIVGASLYDNMERQENPTVVAPYALVKCIYPGANPEDIEKLVVKPLESKIREIEEIKRIESFSVDSAGVLKVKLKDLSDDQVSRIWEELKDKVDKAKSELPAGAYEPEVNTDIVETYGYIVTLSSDNYDYRQLKQFAEDLKEKLKEDKGAAKVEIDGDFMQQINVELDLVKLRQFNISTEFMVKALKARNINIPGGNLDVGNEVKVPVQATGEYKNINEIKNTMVGMSEDGNVIYLKDVAKVSQGYEDRNKYIKVDGKKAVMVGVKYVEGENIVKIGKRFNLILAEFKKDLPKDIKINVPINQSNYVEEAISLFQDNLVSAILLVVLVILISMGIRSAIVVSSSIPVIMMCTFIFMKLFSIQLHQVSIASLIISLSLLVANAIVANDNMFLYMENGLDRETACVRGVKDVQIPILTSTVTTIASFFPLSMMNGVAGKFVKSLPVLVSVALGLSYLTSLTLVPAMGYTFLKLDKKKKKNIFTEKLSNFKFIASIIKKLYSVKSVYEKILRFLMKKPKMVLLTSLVALGLSLLVVPSLGVQLFPFVERDQFTIDLVVKDGSTLDKTQETADKIENLLLKDPSVKEVVYKAGDGLMKFNVTFQENQVASNKAQFIVNADIKNVHKIQEKLNKEISGARIEVKQLELGEPVGLPVQVRISGEDIKTLRAIASDIQKKLELIDEGQNLQNDYGLDSYKLVVDVNQDKANMTGLTTYDIASTIRMAVNGYEATKMKQVDSDDDIPVVIKIPKKDKDNVDVLNQIYFTSQITKENVPLSYLADIKNEFSLNTIVRRDGKRTITIGFYPVEGYSSAELLKFTQKKLENYNMPKGYSMVFGGESEDRSEAFKSLVIPFILAIIAIYMTMVFQFADLRRPFIIMGTIPLSFIGVIWGLKITGFPIGFMALLGGISLMGVVVNNGIVLIDYIEILRKEKELYEAVIESSVTRFRPIMIGMITTVIGLIPMGISGGSLWAPMAYSIIFGLLVSSALTLFVIPAGYLIVEREDSLSARLVKFLKSK